MTSIRRAFQTVNDRRSYELEDDAGRKLFVEEVDNFSMVIRRESGEPAANEDLAPFLEELLPLIAHFANYGNLPLPKAD
jgi:hypothetical protein